jgi:hypothetical protein
VKNDASRQHPGARSAATGCASVETSIRSLCEAPALGDRLAIPAGELLSDMLDASMPRFAFKGLQYNLAKLVQRSLAHLPQAQGAGTTIVDRQVIWQRARGGRGFCARFCFRRSQVNTTLAATPAARNLRHLRLTPTSLDDQHRFRTE